LDVGCIEGLAVEDICGCLDEFLEGILLGWFDGNEVG
jgi:hypothetical protein